MAAGILFQILGGIVAEGTLIKVSCYSGNIEQLLTGRTQGSLSYVQVRI